jgi:hypothetical protein
LSLAIDRNLLRDRSDDSDSVVVMSEWVAVIVALIIGVHHNASVTVVQDFTVLVHVVLGFATASAVVLLEVAPATVVPDVRQSGVDRAINVDHVSLVDAGLLVESVQHFLHLGDAGEGQGWEGGS